MVTVPSQPGAQLACVEVAIVGATGEGVVPIVTVVVPAHPFTSVPITV